MWWSISYSYTYLILSSFYRPCSGQRTKWKPLGCNKRKKIPLIALGDGKWKRRWRGTMPGLSGVLRRKLRAAENQGRLVVINIDEYLTSQVRVLFILSAQIVDNTFDAIRFVTIVNNGPCVTCKSTTWNFTLFSIVQTITAELCGIGTRTPRRTYIK